MDKPKVLVFIDWYAPGYKAGGPVRSVMNLVDHLRERVELHIVTSDTDYTATEPYPEVQADHWTILPGGEKVWYASRKGTRIAVWKQLLREQAWDAIYINGIYSKWFSILPLWLARNMSVRKVVALRGMLASGAMQHAPLKKLLFLSLARTLDLYKNVRFHATNGEEATDVRRHVLQRAEVQVVPNLPRINAGGSHASIAKQVGSAQLVSVARIAVEKNTLFAIERLREVKGAVTFDLYGPVYDAQHHAQCMKAISTLPANVRVELHGPIPTTEVPAMLSNYHALYMPSAGENFGHTMLEALSVGRPLLISDRTPWRNLAEQHAGWDLPLDAPQRFTDAVDELCAMDQAAYDAWSSGAFAFAGRYLSDSSAVEQMYALFTA